MGNAVHNKYPNKFYTILFYVLFLRTKQLQNCCNVQLIVYIVLNTLWL